MSDFSLWANFQDRIGFFTKETASRIPERPGVYGWFFPLYLYSCDLDDFVELVSNLLNYDASCQSVPHQNAEMMFNWDSIQISATRRRSGVVTDEMRRGWDKIFSSDEELPLLSQALMESSIFLPPLYVGRATNLKERYHQHAEQPNLEKNTFATRFAKHASNAGLIIEVCDLLFVCVFTERDAGEILRSKVVNGVLEQVLMRLSAPPFSVR